MCSTDDLCPTCKGECCSERSTDIPCETCAGAGWLEEDGSAPEPYEPEPSEWAPKYGQGRQ